MGERGKALLKAIGESSSMGDDDEEEETETSDGKLAAAEALCRVLDLPEEKASALAKALTSFYENC